MIDDSQPYSIALIAPNGTLSGMFDRLAHGLGCRLSVRAYSSTEEAVAAARGLVEQERPEAICSPMEVADALRAAVDVPVASIRPGSSDLLRTLLPFREKIRRAAFFAAERFLPEVQTVARALNMEILEYRFQTPEEAASRMLEAAAQGAQLGVGPAPVARMRELCGVDGIVLEAGEGAALRALHMAFSLAGFCRRERQPQVDQGQRGIRGADGVAACRRLSEILTRNAGMKDLKKLAAGYAETDAPVLIQGEPGSGKTLFAQGIHQASKRADAPFVAVNCAAIPPDLLESELFGREGSARSGAWREGLPGYIELAHTGTLFLSDINELPGHLQSRLLRVLQEGTVTRAGGARPIHVDVRLISAADKNLRGLAARGLFRQDLFYRCNALPLFIPPLRERGGDILHLACRFLHDSPHGAAFKNMTPEKLEAEAGDLLLSHSWPGNVRELANEMERLALTATIFPKNGLRELLARIRAQEPQSCERRLQATQTLSAPNGLDNGENLKEIVRRAEYAAIMHQLAACNGDYARVAKRLGISRVSLWRKLRDRPQDAEQDPTPSRAD